MLCLYGCGSPHSNEEDREVGTEDSAEANAGVEGIEVHEILSKLPATVLKCVVVRSLECICELSAGLGPVISNEINDFLMLPAALEDLDTYSGYSINTRRTIVVAQLSGDPGEGPEQILIVMPIDDEQLAREAVVRHIRQYASIIDHDTHIIAQSPYSDDDLGAMIIKDKRWLVLGLAEDTKSISDIEEVLGMYSEERAVSYRDWIQYAKLELLMPDDWCLYMCIRARGTMRLVGITLSSRGTAYSMRYEDDWKLLEPISGWASIEDASSWLGQLSAAGFDDLY